jgi:hypothetical protein
MMLKQPRGPTARRGERRGASTGGGEAEPRDHQRGLRMRVVMVRVSVVAVRMQVMRGRMRRLMRQMAVAVVMHGMLAIHRAEAAAEGG